MLTGPRAVRGAAVILAAGLACLPAGLFGQNPLSGRGSAAATYMERYGEIARLAPVAGRVADVNHLVISRDVGQLTFERGKLYLLSPVGGRTVGAVFRGQGRFTFPPRVPAERAELARFAGAPTLDDSLTEAILLFADSTSDQLRALGFGPGPIPGDVGDHVNDLIGSLKGDNEGSFDSDVMGPLLNGETTGFFLARVARTHGDAVLFQVNPSLSEAVQLHRPVSRRQWGTHWAVVSQFPPLVSSLQVAGASRYRHRLGVTGYRLDVRLSEALSANLGMAVGATLTLVPEEPVGPWLLLRLHYKIAVDSARWGTGEPAAVFKARESQDLWVSAGRRLQRGDTVALTLFYHGDLIDRFGDWFYVDPLANWYPVNGQGHNFATFDLTYHSPTQYPLASIGERLDSALAGNVRTTHWVERRPASAATFNLGLFENYHVQHEGAPPLDVLLSEDAHRTLAIELARQGYFLLQQRHMRENVAADVSNSLKLFASLFGESSHQRFRVTEIPYGEGVSFPGIIHLSWGTFQNTSLDGFDEFFRAHEAAHQWWGNDVRPGSYRDAWLSEGLASFSALVYLQAERRHNDEYYRFLDQYKADISADQDDVGPIWIGYRNASPSVRRGYDVMIYEKGAWVFHMLRTMMLDLSTMRADRFTETLRDYYQSYRGSPATTDDFQRVVERHIGAPMDWFFDQWVKGTGLPTYHVAWTSQPAEGGQFTVRFRITQEHVPPEFRMPVLVSVDLGGQRTARFRVQVHGGQTEYVSPPLPSEPRGLTFNDVHSVLAEVRMERW